LNSRIAHVVVVADEQDYHTPLVDEQDCCHKQLAVGIAGAMDFCRLAAQPTDVLDCHIGFEASRGKRFDQKAAARIADPAEKELVLELDLDIRHKVLEGSLNSVELPAAGELASLQKEAVG
jgi:hypothetical protein